MDTYREYPNKECQKRTKLDNTRKTETEGYLKGIGTV